MRPDYPLIRGLAGALAPPPWPVVGGGPLYYPERPVFRRFITPSERTIEPAAAPWRSCSSPPYETVSTAERPGVLPAPGLNRPP